MEKLLLMRKIRNIVLIVLALLLVAFGIERVYNRRPEFQTVAEKGEYYGILDAKFTRREKLRDLGDLLHILEEQYPFFEVNKRVNGVDWLKNKNRYKRIILNTKNDAEFLVAMTNIFDELNDKNTKILTGDLYNRYFKHYYPERSSILLNDRSLARYSFDGELNIDPNNNFIFHNGPVLDTKILVEDEVAYMQVKAMSYYHIEEDYPRIKSFLNEVKDYDKLIIDIRGNEGGSDEYWENMVKLLINDSRKAQYYSFFRQKTKSMLDPFKLTGITILSDLNQDIFAQLPEDVKSDFNFYKLNSIEISPEESVNFQGKIYLLVDQEVFASAEKFAAFSKDTGFATLVGETTGGGMTFEEVPMANMPYGGYIITYSRELVLNSDKTINMEMGTEPHIVVNDPEYKEDYNLDEAIQAIIKD